MVYQNSAAHVGWTTRSRIAIIFICIGVMVSCSKGQNTNKSNTGNWEMKVVTGSNWPVIVKTHPGVKDNLYGFENGDVVKLADGSYHMIITELFDSGFAVPARIGHWKSTDKGDTWVRLGTIVQGNNIPNDPKNNTWSAMWYFDAVANRWNIIWRGFSLFRYASDKIGDEGIDANYSQVSQSILPFKGTEKWWNLNRSCPASFSNIFKAKNGQYYAFIGNEFIGNGKIARADGDWNWVCGLVTATNIDGPWYQDDSKTDPDFNFAENPIVIKDGILILQSLTIYFTRNQLVMRIQRMEFIGRRKALTLQIMSIGVLIQNVLAKKITQDWYGVYGLHVALSRKEKTL